MTSIFDFITGRDTAQSPTQPSLGARAGAAFKRRLGDTLGAIVDNPLARTAGDFANEYWGGTDAPSVGGVAPVPVPVVPSPRGFQSQVRAVDNALLPAAPAGFGAAPVAPMTAADIRGSRVPDFGTGAFMNSRTGAVTNLTAASIPDAADEAANVMRARGVAVYGVGNKPGVRSYADIAGAGIGAMLNQKRAAATEVRDLEYAKIGADIAGRRPAAAKAEAETTALNERIRLAGMEADPVKRAAILAGHNPPETRLQSPVNMQPMPGDKDQSAVVFDPSIGTYTRVPIRTQIRGGVGTDGKYYKTDASGKQVEMTAAEKAQFVEQKRGRGAVQ